MSKTAPAKTNGHPVDAISAVAQKAAARPLPKAAAKAPAKAAVKTPVKAAAKAPSKTAAKAAPKAPARSAGRAAPAPAVKKAAKPAAKSAAKPSASKAAVKPASRSSAKAEAKATLQASPKASPKAAPKAAQAVVEREKIRKPKLVRDSFTMPEEEYAVLALVKKACLKAGFEIKKSELLRVGVALISQIDMATLKSVLASLPQLKTGRPKSS